jgi:excisionase family DNA binding protein
VRGQRAYHRSGCSDYLSVDSFDSLLSSRIDAAVERKLRQVLADLQPTDRGERLHRIPAAAELAAVGEATLRRWIAEGRLPIVRIPGRVAGSTELRVRAADLDDFIRALAGDRRAPSNTNGRDVAARSKRKSLRTPASLQQLVDARLKQAGNGPASTIVNTKTAHERA